MVAAAPRYFMHLHNFQQQGQIIFVEATAPDGPRHDESWTSNITVTYSVTGRGLFTYTAVARSKQAARDVAAYQALAGMGFNVAALA